jgi:hypothetical protein
MHRTVGDTVGQSVCATSMRARLQGVDGVSSDGERRRIAKIGAS